MESQNNQTPKIFKGILFSIISLVIFYLANTIIALLLSLIFSLLLEIPVVGNLINFFLKIGDNTLDAFVLAISVLISYMITSAFVGVADKEAPTRKLVLKILGIACIALNVIFLIFNLISGEPVYANLVMLLAGIGFIRSGNNEI